MVEKIVQNEGAEKAEEGNRIFKLPKHIKQQGLGGNCPEIYIEDYAEGYLRRLAGSDYTECRVAVLVGEFIKSEGKRYVFVRGAIEAEEIIVDHTVQFTSEVWSEIYGKIKRYFPQFEAVGWFLGGPEFLTEITDHIRQLHVDWFGGRDRVLYRMDPVEKEAAFYLYDKGELRKWPGYCIYYEKNEEMQDYLVAGTPPSVDAGYEEPVLAKLGKRLGRTEDDVQESIGFQVKPAGAEEVLVKRERKKTGKSSSGHGAGIAAAIVLLAIGAYFFKGKESGLTGNSGMPTPIPVPTAAEYESIEGKKDVLQTNAKVGPTEPVISWEGAEGWLFDKEFVPITEEPYEPGITQEGPQNEPQKEVTAVPLPATSTPVPTPTPEPEEDVIKEEPMKLYIVQSGDTLAGICRRFYGGVSRMEEIKGINQILDENWIYAGQELYLP